MSEWCNKYKKHPKNRKKSLVFSLFGLPPKVNHFDYIFSLSNIHYGYMVTLLLLKKTYIQKYLISLKTSSYS